MECAVGAGCAESAMNGVEGDVVNRENLGGVALGGFVYSVAFE